MYWEAITSHLDYFLAHRDPKEGMELIKTGLLEQQQPWSNSDVSNAHPLSYPTDYTFWRVGSYLSYPCYMLTNS